MVVLCFRYLIERLDEKALLSIDDAGDAANCAVTEYQREGIGGKPELVLRRYNFVAPLAQEGTIITAERKVNMDR
ncbi:MAG: phosphoglycerate mutase [Subtercola sp.]|nr:phosphoglycerate mutase [Subtercola sp.]